MNDEILASRKAELLSTLVEHIDITQFDARPLVAAMAKMAFTSRDTARASAIFQTALKEKGCAVFLALAGSTSAGGCMHVYRDMVRYGMVDAIVATGASIVDMDFFEALGFRHYQGSPALDDNELRRLGIDRIYDTLIDEDELQACDLVIGEIANSLEPRPYSSREFIKEMGRWLAAGNAKHTHSLVQEAFEHNVPIFCPAFTDSSAGFGLVKHQADRMRAGEAHMSIDSIADFRELTEIKVKSDSSAVFIVGGGVPKNFLQDTVVCAKFLGQDAPMHKYAVQITVADVRDGACSSSTLKEAASWGKVDTVWEQMVYAEATTVVPLIVSAAWHEGLWKGRDRRNYAKIFA